MACCVKTDISVLLYIQYIPHQTDPRTPPPPFPALVSVLNLILLNLSSIGQEAAVGLR